MTSLDSNWIQGAGAVPRRQAVAVNDKSGVDLPIVLAIGVRGARNVTTKDERNDSQKFGVTR